MSPICQSFVQNAWRKDLCSNCFKSKEDHGCNRKMDYSSMTNCTTTTECPVTKRYVGVAGGRSTLYGRNYYGQNAWNPIMIDNSNKECRSLKSPGLIKGMNTIIKQENERNRNNRTTVLDCEDSQVTMEVKPIPKSSIPNDSWIISQIIADTREYDKRIRLSDKQQGDSSSDLGSDASHDTTSGSSASGCSGHYDFRGPDDTDSGGSEPDSAHDEEDDSYSPVEDQFSDDDKSDKLVATSSSHADKTSDIFDNPLSHPDYENVDATDRRSSVMSEPSSSLTKPVCHSILKFTKSLPLSRTVSVTFTENNNVIGYGGDVDYSDGDDEDYDDQDDDDDKSSIASCDLSPEERELKYLTEKNTNLNSEDFDEQQSSIDTETSVTKDASPPTDPKLDVKVKLKRSPPIGGVKPQLKPNLSVDSDDELSPMKGIKPKFVSRDEEMKENVDFDQMYENSQKITSIDNTISQMSSVDNTQNVTSIDSIILPKADKITSFDDVSTDPGPKVTTVDEKPKVIATKLVSDEEKPRKVSSIERSEIISNQDDEVLTKENANVEATYDYTVKSAQVTMAEPSISKLVHERNKRKVLHEMENSKENFEKVRSAVIPLAIINIKRRNSFLESQLSGSVYNHKDANLLIDQQSTEENEKCQVKKGDYESQKDTKLCKDVSTSVKLSEPLLAKKLSTAQAPADNRKGPQSSFLHSGKVRPSADTGHVHSVIYSSPEGSSRSSSKGSQSTIYASTSILKGLPGPKPATTPKPKLPPKTRALASRTVSAPVSKVQCAISTPNLTTMTGNDDSVHAKMNAFGSSSSSECLLSKPNGDTIVYDVPVTVASSASTSSSTVSAPSPTSSSSGYSSTSNVSSQDLHETKNEKLNQQLSSSSPQLELRKLVEEDHQSGYRSTFEANRNVLSTNLNFYASQPNLPPSIIIPEVPPPKATIVKEVLEKPQMTLDSVSYEEENYPKPMVSQNLIKKTNSYDEHCYINLPPTQESQDFDSFSSFTDDFDDDDDGSTTGHYTVNPEEEIPKKTERSSSATPIYRNSVGPVIVCPLSVGDSIETTKRPAVRSHSAPRSVENKVCPSAFTKAKESSYKFSFSKSGFFRPSSPPTQRRKSVTERGRDRTKKSHSVFSLRKLLRLGSGGDKISKAPKEVRTTKELDSEREARKMKLQIIHPLDYNTNGVEVIARPEKRVPAFDGSDMYSSSSQLDSRRHSKNSDANPSPPVAFVEQLQRNATSLISFIEPSQKIPSLTKVPKKNSFLKKKKKTDRNDSEKKDIRPAVSYVRRPSTSSNVSDSAPKTSGLPPLNASSHLGYNSEGRPKPPPPPRKTSLEAVPHEVFFIATNPAPLESGPHVISADHMMAPPAPRIETDTSSLSSNSSSTRPSRPPPPRRTPSVSSSTKSNSSRMPTTTTATKDHTLYANLGNARASFTPRKPGRSSSVREEEKRRAPNPPSGSSEGGRVAKGPAPLVPHVVDPRNHDYEIIAGSTPEKKETLFEGGRTSTLTNLSLKDQYGAVIGSNLETISNMLDQLCRNSSSQLSDSMLRRRICQWSDVTLTSSNPKTCGPRLFYPARSGVTNITVMVTPETKLEEDSLLCPPPFISFRDDLPSAVLNIRQSSEQQSVTQGSVWILPRMTLSSLEDFGHRSQRLLLENPREWQKHICLFLLQMVTALKQLQAKGIEESNLDLVLVIDNFEGESSPRLLMVPPSDGSTSSGGNSHVSLCHCAAAATQLLLGNARPVEAAMQGPVLSPPSVPSPHAFNTLVTTLREERASSLTRAKCILEAMLFGPANLRFASEPNLDSTLQKWLDLERANVLHSLIKDQSSGNSRATSLVTKFHLIFLVRSNMKCLAEAIRVLEAPDVTNF